MRRMRIEHHQGDTRWTWFRACPAEVKVIGNTYRMGRIQVEIVDDPSDERGEWKGADKWIKSEDLYLTALDCWKATIWEFRRNELTAIGIRREFAAQYSAWLAANRKSRATKKK